MHEPEIAAIPIPIVDLAVTWECNKGAGDIAMKAGFESEHTSPTKAGKGAWEIEYAAAAAAAAAASEERQLR